MIYLASALTNDEDFSNLVEESIDKVDGDEFLLKIIRDAKKGKNVKKGEVLSMAGLN